MNLVLADCEEFRKVKRSGKETEEKRSLGLAIVRGATIVSASVESPPPADPSSRLNAGQSAGVGQGAAAVASGPGVSKPIGRGMPSSLGGPMAGQGGMGFGRGGPPAGFPPGFAPPPGFQPPPMGRGFPPR